MATGSFSFSQWATVTPAAGWVWTSGRLTGGELDDVVGHHPSNGTVWVGRHDGDRFTLVRWATLPSAGARTIVAGRFTGHDLDDIAVYDPADGRIHVGLNTGAGFTFTHFATVAPAAGWSIAAGPVLASGLDDLVAHHPGNGSIWVGANDGVTFSFTQWADGPDGITAPLLVADVSGDGRPDVVLHQAATGTVWVGSHRGGSFEMAVAHAFPAAGAASRQVAVGSVFGHGRGDLIAHRADDGSIDVGLTHGDGFLFDRWATVTPATGWRFLAGRFTPDQRADLLGYHSGDGELWVGRFSDPAVEGYAWPQSVSPGEAVSLHVSSETASDVLIARHDADAAGVRSVPVARLTAAAGLQDVPVLAWRDGCGWTPSATWTVPATTRSGIYSARCQNGSGQQAHLTFVVRPDPARRSEVLVVANTNTWLAYNGWGGQSKYTRRSTVSFLRPDPDASPVATGFGPGHLTRAELWLLGFLEREGHRPDVCTDADLHDGLDLTPARCLVLDTHPEYWTMEMRDALEAYLAGGGSLLYLGGNGLFEVGTYSDDRTSMTFLGGIDHGPREPAAFRALGRSELSVLGVATERCGAAGAAYRVLLPDHPLFAFTGVAAGDAMGSSGLNTMWSGNPGGQASAWEVDTLDGPGALGTAAGCEFTVLPMPPAAPPDGVEVIARADADAKGRGADLVFHRHPGGGIVLSAGSITFGGSLAVDAVLRQVVRNALIQAGVT